MKPGAPQHGIALFPTGNPAAPVREVRVFVLELWESVKAARVQEIREHSATPGETHILPLAELASETTLAKKRAAFATKLSTIPAGYCPRCWGRGRAIPAATPEACPFVEKHQGHIEPPAARAA